MHPLTTLSIAAVIGCLTGCLPLSDDGVRAAPPSSDRELSQGAVSRRYWRVFQTKENGECYLRPRPEEQTREYLSCDDALDLARELNKRLVFEYRVSRPTRDVIEAIITPYPSQQDILLCCDGKRAALGDLCAYTERKAASEMQTQEARLFSPEEAKVLVECLNEEYVTGAP
jgi:hypothetical protein